MSGRRDSVSSGGSTRARRYWPTTTTKTWPSISTFRSSTWRRVARTSCCLPRPTTGTPSGTCSPIASDASACPSTRPRWPSGVRPAPSWARCGGPTEQRSRPAPTSGEAVLYIATVHFKSPKWIDIQSQFLRRHITEPFRTFAVLNQIPSSWNSRFDTVIPAKGRHEAKLNLLAAEMSEVARPDDILLFVDGDAFPVADPMPTVYKALAESSLVAVRRNENWGDCQPHPSFCAIRVSEWERLHGDWSPGRTWLSDTGHTVTDPGANLLASLERTGSTWTPLLRSNTWNPHPLWFGIYGDIVYHHGAGFRAPRARADRGSTEIFHRGEGIPVVAVAARRVNQLL